MRCLALVAPTPRRTRWSLLLVAHIGPCSGQPDAVPAPNRPPSSLASSLRSIPAAGRTVLTVLPLRPWRIRASPAADPLPRLRAIRAVPEDPQRPPIHAEPPLLRSRLRTVLECLALYIEIYRGKMISIICDYLNRELRSIDKIVH